MPRVWLITAGLVGLVTVVFEIIYRHAAHPYFMWHAMPVFDLIFGFIGCIIVGLVSKGLGHTWLEREETYYGDER